MAHTLHYSLRLYFNLGFCLINIYLSKGKMRLFGLPSTKHSILSEWYLKLRKEKYKSVRVKGEEKRKLNSWCKAALSRKHNLTEFCKCILQHELFFLFQWQFVWFICLSHPMMSHNLLGQTGGPLPALQWCFFMASGKMPPVVWPIAWVFLCWEKAPLCCCTNLVMLAQDLSNACSFFLFSFISFNYFFEAISLLKVGRSF